MSDVDTEDHAIEHDDTPQDTDEDMAAARMMMGWKPRDQWEGNPKDWKTAKQMVKIARENLRDSRFHKNELGRTREKLNAIEAKFGQIESHLSRADVAEIEKRMDAAFERGDATEYAAAKKELAQVGTARSGQAQPVDPPAFADFKDQNDWFKVKRTNTGFQAIGEHAEATDYAITLGRRLGQEYGGDTPELYAEIRKRVAKRFPEISGEPEPPAQQRQPPRQPITGPGRSAGGRERITGKLTVATMNASQRKAADQFGLKPEDYVSEYNKQYGDA